jgi:hypothetical protein
LGPPFEPDVADTPGTLPPPVPLLPLDRGSHSRWPQGRRDAGQNVWLNESERVLSQQVGIQVDAKLLEELRKGHEQLRMHAAKHAFCSQLADTPGTQAPPVPLP